MKRLGILVAIFLALAPVCFSLAGGNAKPFKSEGFRGKVVPLADLLKKQGAKLDEDAAPHWLALATEDGKVLSLVKDDGSRMFYKDKQLLNRPMQLTGRVVPGTSFLQVVSVHSLVKGKLHDVYYWCDICSIRAFEPGACACCGAVLEFREVPAK